MESVTSWTAVLTRSTAAAATTTAAPAGAFFARSSDIHREVAAIQAGSIKRRQRFLSLFIGAHGDESKAARTSGGAVHHEVGFEDGAVSREGVLEIIFRGFEGEISDKQFIVHFVIFFSKVAPGSRERSRTPGFESSLNAVQ